MSAALPFAPAPDPWPALGDDEVHVWSAPLGRAPAEALGELLNEEERERAARFRFDRHRFPWAAARGSLRAILAPYLAADPRELRFGEGERGKPFLEGEGLEFNLSHSGELALIAVARGTDVGVDVEQHRELSDLEALARRAFSEPEFGVLMRLPEPRRRGAFFDCWSRKEAFIKATGEGLSRGLGGFDVSLGPDAEPALLSLREPPGNATDWTLVALDPAPGYAGALVYRGVDRRTRCWRASLATGRTEPRAQ